jgi:hypothetical protein
MELTLHKSQRNDSHILRTKSLALAHANKRQGADSFA